MFLCSYHIERAFQLECMVDEIEKTGRVDGSSSLFHYLVAIKGLYGEYLQIKTHIFIILFGELEKLSNFAASFTKLCDIRE